MSVGTKAGKRVAWKVAWSDSWWSVHSLVAMTADSLVGQKAVVTVD